LSFSEVLRFKKLTFQGKPILTPGESGDILKLLSDYLVTGGFPEIILSPATARNYLSALFDSVLLKDIVKRFRIRKSQQFYDLAIIFWRIIPSFFLSIN